MAMPDSPRIVSKPFCKAVPSLSISVSRKREQVAVQFTTATKEKFHEEPFVRPNFTLGVERNVALSAS